MIIGYMYIFGTLLLLTGEVLAGFVLLIPHGIISVVTNGPTFAKTQTTWGTQEQAWIFDLTIFFALLMVIGSKMDLDSFGGGTKKAKKTSTAEDSD